MNRQIRQGVFETNSSSTHTITIAKNLEKGQMMSVLALNSEDKLEISKLNNDHYGWQFEFFEDARNKLVYSTALAMHIDDYVKRKVFTIDLKQSCMSVLLMVLSEQVGIPIEDIIVGIDVNYEGEEKGLDDVNIDHQTWDGGELNSLFENPENLRQFIFNPASTLQTGNDNVEEESTIPVGVFFQPNKFK